MKLEWDEEKCRQNLKKHGVDFAVAEHFNWDSALTREDTRSDYGETRLVSIGLIDSRHYVAVWVERNTTLRLISLRKANKRETSFYEKTFIY